jgi:hypothetical protein
MFDPIHVGKQTWVFVTKLNVLVVTACGEPVKIFFFVAHLATVLASNQMVITES